ncbi:FAD-dependent oxidoreductase [Rhizobiaceae bacterium BDR2-2]|uniref:FAD-dependent oxidoreductase n=1 Tax=Ectorhizobium quercum TaxID=2965071 RepID=A0AAE3MZY9_9HYPH|nr:FAD-dependent oxidoreductase [Ectorhizobium quercum]MCX8997452.1 FAD-dependent oxidoreductase [Ectorhizobium quercum]
MKPTDLSTPGHFLKVVDCQWACPAHTPVPHYIRLLAEGRPADAYMVNWEANVFPGILGRTCDRPCEPACRRGRVEKEPVAICRLKRAAADFKGDVAALMPSPAKASNGRRVALVGAGPASLTVARDLAPLGYDCAIFDREDKAGGMMRTRIPHFRVPEEVIDEETGYVLGLGAVFHGGHDVTSMKALLAAGFDAVFVGAGAPRGQDLALPGRSEAAARIHVGVEWLAAVYFRHVDRIGRRVVVIGGGNTAVDCARTARRLGGGDVTVVLRRDIAGMAASEWEREALLEEGATIAEHLAPRAFLHEDGRLTGVLFDPVETVEEGGRRSVRPTGAAPVTIACDDVVIAIGQQPAFPWIERELGIRFNDRGLPVLEGGTFRSTHPKVFFGGDAAFGAKNIITAVAHGHEAAISIHLMLSGHDIEAERPAPVVDMADRPVPAVIRARPEVSAKARHPVPQRPAAVALADIEAEVELGFDEAGAAAEAQRCFGCDLQTVFDAKLCVECKACEAVCPTDCITFTRNGEEADLRRRLRAPAANTAQALYLVEGLASGRVMVKNEDLCLHCGLCAQNCPTGAWRMQRFTLKTAHAGTVDRQVPACAAMTEEA